MITYLQLKPSYILNGREGSGADINASDICNLQKIMGPCQAVFTILDLFSHDFIEKIIKNSICNVGYLM